MQELRIQQHFIDSADLYYQLSETLAKPVDAAVQALLASVTGGGKVLVVGAGASVVLAQYFCSLLVGGFERERPGLPAMGLGTDAVCASATSHEEGVARQVHALGQAGDVLVVIAASGDAPSLAQAVAAAHDREMTVLAISGGTDGAMAKLLRETDVHVNVPHERPAQVREVQLLVLHCLCDGIDAQLLGEQEPM
ncbi:MAG: SIS domain-containing protein [Limnohabitans sp.]